jgi:hypothetical protein
MLTVINHRRQHAHAEEAIASGRLIIGLTPTGGSRP